MLFSFSPSQTALEAACHLFKIKVSNVSNGAPSLSTGSSSSINASIPGSWGELTIAFIIIIAFFLLIYRCLIVSCISKTSRNAALIAHVLYCISSFGVCIFYAAELHGYTTELSLIVSTVYIISFLTRLRTSLETRVCNDLTLLYPIFVLLIVSVNYYFPQTIFNTCNYDSVSKILYILLLISLLATVGICCLGDLLMLLRADQVDIMKDGKKIGYLEKKGNEWVEIYLEQNEKNTKEDLYFIV